MSKQAYVTWVLCCPDEECEEYEAGFIRVLASCREGYNARVAKLTAQGWVLREWRA